MYLALQKILLQLKQTSRRLPTDEVEQRLVAAGTGETKGKELNGYIPGQFLPGTMTDFVKGEGSSVRPASGVVWDGFVTGTGALAPRETAGCGYITHS